MYSIYESYTAEDIGEIDGTERTVFWHPDIDGTRIETVVNNKIPFHYFRYIRSKAGEIALLYIYENYRGYGVSNTLLEDAINKYGGRSLGMYADNEIAIHLYQKYGFKIVKTKTYSDGTKVYIMVLEQ